MSDMKVIGVLFTSFQMLMITSNGQTRPAFDWYQRTFEPRTRFFGQDQGTDMERRNFFGNNFQPGQMFPRRPFPGENDEKGQIPTQTPPPPVQIPGVIREIGPEELPPLPPSSNQGSRGVKGQGPGVPLKEIAGPEPPPPKQNLPPSEVTSPEDKMSESQPQPTLNKIPVDPVIEGQRIEVPEKEVAATKVIPALNKMPVDPEIEGQRIEIPDKEVAATQVIPTEQNPQPSERSPEDQTQFSVSVPQPAINIMAVVPPTDQLPDQTGQEGVMEPPAEVAQVGLESPIDEDRHQMGDIPQNKPPLSEQDLFDGKSGLERSSTVDRGEIEPMSVGPLQTTHLKPELKQGELQSPQQPLMSQSPDEVGFEQGRHMFGQRRL